MPWALIAARTSGASAIRSTSCWASSLASSRRQTSSTSSLSIASSSARLTASLSSAPSTASSTTGPSRTLAIARSTALLSTAATIASSAAISTARSIPVALLTVRAPRTPTPSSRAGIGAPTVSGRPVLHFRDSTSGSSKRSRSSACAGRIFSRAVSMPNHSARSTSGNSCWLPLRGGHSIAKVLLARVAGSKSASAAQASTTLPARWLDRAELDQLLGVELGCLSRAPLRARGSRRRAAPPRPRSAPSGSTRRRRLSSPRRARPGGRAGTRSRRRAAEEEDAGAALGGHRPES